MLDLSTLHLDYDMDSVCSNNRVNMYLGIDLKEEYKNRAESMDSVDKGWPG